MYENTLEKILCDNSSGSSEIVIRINRLFKKNINNTLMMRNSLMEITGRMEKFEVVMKYVGQIDKFLKCRNRTTLNEFIWNYESENLDVYDKIYQNVKPFIKSAKSIFTLSNSKTIYEVLKRIYLGKNNIKAIISESRPIFEGRMLAKKLLKLEMKVTVITDCQMAESISECDAIFLGADKILLNGDVVNKTGSKNAGIIARHYAKPVFVLSSTSKFSKQTKLKPKLHSSDKIWKYKHRNLKIENRYFEVVPRKLITKIITDKNC